MTSQNIGKFSPNRRRENSFSNKTYQGLEPPTPPLRNRSMSPLQEAFMTSQTPELTMTSQDENEEIYDDTELDQDIYDDAETEELYDDTEMTSEVYDDVDAPDEIMTSQSNIKSTVCMAELMRKHEERNSAMDKLPPTRKHLYESI